MKINLHDRQNQQKLGTDLPCLQSHGLATEKLNSVRCLSLESDFQLEEELRVFVEESVSIGDYTLAISLLDLLLDINPDNAVDYNNRGLMHFRNNQFAEAITDLDHAIELNPKLDSAYNNRANYHAAVGDLAAAIADYDVALDLNPANVRAWINQGITFRELGLYDLALEDFDIALIIGRKLQGRILAERGRTYHLRGDWNCANNDYHRALTQLSSASNSSNYLNKVNNWLNELLNPTNF
jgi:tetratricopeptide (TPR) repeat protein